MVKKALLILISITLLAGCGYKIALTGKDAAFTIYPSDISNMSKDIAVTSKFRDSVKLYLATINALAEKDEAQYTGEFVLEDFETVGSSGSSATTTVHVRLTMSVNISDSQGDKVFSQKFITAENYDNTSSQSETRANKDTAVEKAIERIMTDFRHAFERKQ